MIHFMRSSVPLAGVLLAMLALSPPASDARAQGTAGGLTVTVTDAATKRPVDAARVHLVGTNYGGATTAEGKATIRGVAANNYTLRVLRIGYQEQTRPVTIAAGRTGTIEIAMTAAAVNLAAVVTTATGEQRRVEIGNSTTDIQTAKVLQAAPVASLNDVLNSRAPGVSVTSGTQTGTGARIRVRGMNSVSLSNEPIWIIDGIRMTSNNSSFSTVTGNGASGNTGGNNASRIGDLNPDDIENIEVVKGPSAATLYGTDAANGVILVTTKRGRAGAARWTISGESGLLKDRNYYPAAYTLWGKRPGETVSSRGFCNLQRVATGACAADSTSSLNLFKNSYLTPLGTGNRQ